MSGSDLKIRAAPITALCVALSALAAARPLPALDTVPNSSTEEITVVGEHEGPRMWRVSQNDHSLWILGTVTPLPRKMIWQSSSVQALLQETQEVLPAWPAIGVGANPFTALRLYFEWRKIQKSPDRMKLKDQLPPPLYARFSALKARYAPHDNSLEDLRPMLAAGRLLDDTLDASGLTFRNEVQNSVVKLARKQGVKIHQNKLKIEDPVDVLKELGATPREGEIACLEAIVTRLETDLGGMRARARAWALGDVATLRRLPHTDDRTACLEAVTTSNRVRTLVERAEDDWLIEAQQALRENQTTLALQSMDRLLGDHGILATLRAKGYQVEGP